MQPTPLNALRPFAPFVHTGVIVKPVHGTTLVDDIKGFLAARAARGEAAASASALSAAAQPRRGSENGGDDDAAKEARLLGRLRRAGRSSLTVLPQEAAAARLREAQEVGSLEFWPIALAYAGGGGE